MATITHTSAHFGPETRPDAFHRVLHRIVATTDTAAPFIVRLALGVVIFPHGAQKLLGWYGGNGYSGTMDFMSRNLGIPAFLVLLDIVAEFFGSLALITGFMTRIAAFGIGVVMLVATLVVHTPNGFFMNWTGQQAGEGFEFHLLALGMALALLIQGGGLWSLDRGIDRANYDRG